ncbi:MAG: hypothetical protein H0T46_16050 [Deltaproteobacteria bacterium]|nr:hypothetical protein [Deltaproteobacteria bacterium]
MATNIGTKTEPQHPPLARDAQGNLIAVPEGTAAWRICRQTTGRPKEIVGPDKKSMRFPLEMTPEELVDLCGVDAYRLYALDELGKVLDYVVTVDVGREPRELRNAAPETTLLPTLRHAATAPSSDLRFALEAMTQMMRVNSEALRAVTESQADWLKSITSSRGFFRNGAPPVPPPEPARHDEEDGDADDEPTQNKTIYDVLAPFAEHWAPSVKPLMAMLAGGAGAKSLASGAAATEAGDPSLASKPSWEIRDVVDLNYAAAKAKAKREAKHASASDDAPSTQSLQVRVMTNPKLMAHFLAIKPLLDPDEAAQIFALGERLNEHQQEWLITQVSASSPAEAAALLRTTLVELRASTETAE